MTLEYATPPDYVFGYLYIAPILLASSRFKPRTTWYLTLLAAALTLLNLWVPGRATTETSTVASRVIAVFALIVTGVLGDRYRRNQDLLVHQQAQLQAQEKLSNLREDFASTLTHDLKTPLLGAIETLTALQNEHLGSINTTQKKACETMIRSHKMSLQLVQTLLDVYRNDSEGLTLQLVPVDLVSIAQEAAAALTGLTMSRQVYISLHYGESDFRRFLWVHGDTLQLQRVFINLLTNAINHSPRGERVDVMLKSQDPYQVVQVMDRGPGIVPSELPHLFERFYQGNSNRQARGSGLGLYLSRQIVEAHHGTIWAENRVVQGTVFGFRLPALPPQLALLPPLT